MEDSGLNAETHVCACGLCSVCDYGLLVILLEWSKSLFIYY